MTRLLAFAVLLLIAGCASTNQSMSAEQIAASTKDKSASCVYAKVTTVWGTAETIVMGYDQRTISNGGIIVGDKCSSLDAKDIKPAPTAYGAEACAMTKPLEAVTGITIGILLLVAVVFLTVMFSEQTTADQKTMVITAAVAALGTIGGYWLNSSADQAKKNNPDAPSTVTTTVTKEAPPA